MKKIRKLQPKIERLFKAIELKYSKNNFYCKFDIDKCGVLKDTILNDFKNKHNVNIHAGFGCLVIEDELTHLKYLVGYNNEKLFIECKVK